ncbi:MAG: C25 family cysteine peptidase [Verrucomicrobiaceae bacterium]
MAHPPSFATALAPLKKARAAQGYQVISIPGATPELIHQRIAELDLGERERDCLLVVRTTALIPGAEGRHHRMKGVPSDSRYAMKRDGTTPLFAVGRLPAATPAQAKMLVSKILAFEEGRRVADSEPKRAILLVGDPIGGPKRMWAADALVSALSRSLVRKAHSSWTFSGAADVPGHPFAAPEGEFPARFVAELNKPYDVGAYFGHSSSSSLCQLARGANLIEGLQNQFTGDRWDGLSPSSRRGLFLSCGCYCLDGDEAVGYRSVQAPGGPVAFIGATGESYSAPGYLAAKGAVSAMKENPPATAGEWFLAVQEAIATARMSRPLFFVFDRVDGTGGERGLRDQRLEHLEMWMLVGDPATKLF